MLRLALLVAAFCFILPEFAFAQARGRLRGDAANESLVGLRVTFPGGDAVGDADWGDFYGIGFGLETGYSQHWPVGKSVDLGYYALISLDFLQGDEVDFFDPVIGPYTIEPDTLMLTRIVGGGRIRENLSSKVFLEQYLGIGVVLYPSTDAELTIPGLGSASGEAIDSTFTYTFEIGFKFGSNVSRNVDLCVGVSYQINGAPDIGRDFDDGVTEFDDQQNVLLIFSADFGF